MKRRIDGRRANELRPLNIETGYLKFAAGSALIRAGDTAVLCAASIREEVPEFLRGKGRGWITAEYAMLPASTQQRKPRESAGKIDGRTMEIRRIIGRALRAAVDLEKLGERTIWLDCDVLQADGGTRTLAVTGAWVALTLAVRDLCVKQIVKTSPIINQVAAASVGIFNGTPLLDLNYAEDSRAEVDMNVVMASTGKLIEIQGTAEGQPFDRKSLDRMLTLAGAGCRQLMTAQRAALKKGGAG